MYKVALVGLGEVAQLMHLPIILDMKDMFQVTAVSDVSESLINFIAEKYHVKPFASAFEMIQDPDVDVVMILSPDQHHGEYMKAALEAGKHVFVEKPVTLCLDELDELIELEKKYPNQMVMVGYMRRYAAPFLKAKEILKNQPMKTNHVRCRDVILEGPFYIGQTRIPFYPNDIAEDVIDSSCKKKNLQLELALGKDATKNEKTTYQMLTGLGCHTLSAVRELFGMPQKILNVATEANGQHIVMTMQYDGFLCNYELVNDQTFVEFDAAIEIYQGSRKLKVKYETPYVRYQPSVLEVIESTQTETKTTIYGPFFTDAFKTELTEFYHCLKDGKHSKTTLTDARNDLVLFGDIINTLRKFN